MTENKVVRCDKGHLLGGVSMHKIHERPGHRKIVNARQYIQDRLKHLAANAPRGYTKREDDIDPSSTVRTLKPITYRILDLFLHSNLYMLLNLTIYNERELKLLLNLNMLNWNDYLKKRIENDYEVIKKILDTKEAYILIHSILYEMPNFLIKKNFSNEPLSHAIRDEFEVAFERLLVEPKLRNVLETINKYKNVFTPEKKFDETRILLNEVENTEFIEKIVPKYPLIKQMRMSRKGGIDYFENCFLKLNLSVDYPLIDSFIKKRFELKKLTAFPPLIKIVNNLLDQFDHKITRNEAREKMLMDCMSRKEFDKLMKLWNSHLNKKLSEGCKEIDGVELTKLSPLCLLLVDKKLELGSGIQTKLNIEYLASCQNEFLEQALSFSDKLEYFKKFDREPILVNQAKANHVINVDEFNYEDCLNTYSITNPKYGCGLELDYDYDKIEQDILNKLIVGKRLLDIKPENIRTIQYNGELLYNNYIIDDIRRKIAQTELDKNSLNEVMNLLNSRSNGENKIDLIKSVYSSLVTLLCYLNTSKLNCKDYKLRDYSNLLDLNTISAASGST